MPGRSGDAKTQKVKKQNIKKVCPCVPKIEKNAVKSRLHGWGHKLRQVCPHRVPVSPKQKIAPESKNLANTTHIKNCCKPNINVLQFRKSRKKGSDFMTIKTKKGGRPSKRPDLQMLAMLYEQMTAKEIAEKYGVKESTVRSWIARARKAGE